MNRIVVAGQDVVAAEETGSEVSWRAIFAGSMVGSAVIFFLLFVGAGAGLSIVTAPEATAGTVRSGLTLGGIYFIAAQAFGMAVGGYLAGRWIGPLLESEAEETFHSASHGLVVWALSVLATATMVTLSGLILSASGLTAAAILGAPNTTAQQGEYLTPGVTGYWVDTLFRPAEPQSGNAASPGSAIAQTSEQMGMTEARAEVGRILNVGLARGGQLSQPDHDRIAMLVGQFAHTDATESARRVNDAQNSIRQQELTAAEGARRVVRNLSLLLAAALIFGALVASASAVLGRSIDDKARSRP